MQKQVQYKTKGMQRDLSASSFNQEFAYENMNLRITATDNNTMLSLTNEKGNKHLLFKVLAGYETDILGVPVGYAVLNDILCIFTYTVQDETSMNGPAKGLSFIYRIEKQNDEFLCKKLFEGTMFIDVTPIQTLAFYENESIQKVYWVDGNTQPKFINIADNTLHTDANDFNFSKTVDLNHTLSITKYNTGGTFSPGTIQYAFSYYNKFAQQSRIVEQSPLYYLSPKERGLAADAKSSCSFKIKIANTDKNFDFIRLYSIVRSSANTTPECKIVGDYSIADLDNYDKPVELNQNTTYSYAYVADKTFLYDLTTGKTSDVLTSDNVVSAGTTSVTTVTYTIYQVTLDSNTFIYYKDIGYYFNKFKIQDYEKVKFYITVTIDSGNSANNTIQFACANNSTNYTSIYYMKSIYQGKGIEVIDNGSIGTSIDSTELFYIGGEALTAKTIAQKDNTLFLGNIELTKPNIGELKVESVKLKDYVITNISSLTSQRYDYYNNAYYDGYSQVYYNPSMKDAYNYDINNNRNSQQTKKFKFGENYRLGFVAQYQNGAWSEVIWLGDHDNLIKPLIKPGTSSYFDGTYYTGGWKYTLSAEASKILADNNFKRIMPVVVYPSLPDRKVICQGILSPTVYNVKDRYENCPFAQSSWYFRFFNHLNNYEHCYYHGESLSNNLTDHSEMQNLVDNFTNQPCMQYKKNESDTTYTWMSDSEFVSYFAEDYFIDNSILTFHSPEIDIGSELDQADYNDVKLRVVGFSPISKDYHHTYCSTSSIGINADLSEFISSNDSQFARGEYADGIIDLTNTSGISQYQNDYLLVGYMTYPWHRNTSLNNSKALNTTQSALGTRSAMIKNKITSSLYYGNTHYELVTDDFTSDLNANVQDISITVPQLFNSDEMTAIKIPSPENSGLSNLVYYGNIDKVAITNSVNMSNMYLHLPDISTGTYTENTYADTIGINKTLGYPIITTWFKNVSPTAPTGDFLTSNVGYYFTSTMSLVDDLTSYLYTNAYLYYESDSSYTLKYKEGTYYPSPAFGSNSKLDVKNRLYYNDGGSWSKDPIQIKYKSTPHLVFAFNYDKTTTINVLPSTAYPKTGDSNAYTAYFNTRITYNHSPFWSSRNQEETNIINQLNINFDSDKCKYYNEGLLIGELYRTFSGEQLKSRFGGQSQAALANNIWTRCGDPVLIDSTNGTTIYFKEGDTYLERYDCLKTYPYTTSDTNSIIELFSTEVESRINLDARYDRNRGLKDNTIITTSNFNLFNLEGYNQNSNFFTYNAIDYDRYINLKYPNTIIWSTEKSLGEDIDSWSDIDATSTLDLDGDKGEIVDIVLLNNALFSFQDKGIANLLFNSRVQVNASDGQPIEITNGTKMQGKRYISNSIGCYDRSAVCKTPSGIYFIDGNTRSLYLYNGQLNNISDSKGFHSYFNTLVNKDNINDCYSFNGISLLYDNQNSELLIVSKDKCLGYSELTQYFTSFYSYECMFMLFNIGNNEYTFNVNMGGEDSYLRYKNYFLWQQWEGDYNTYFDYYSPYYTTIVCNPDINVDKIFNNVEFRADTWNYANVLQGCMFDTLDVWNEYQSGSSSLTNIGSRTFNGTTSSSKNIPSTLKQKFRTWRANIPRDSTNKRDRMRNPWLYIKLSKQTSNTNKAMLHDIVVDYFQ